MVKNVGSKNKYLLFIGIIVVSVFVYVEVIFVMEAKKGTEKADVQSISQETDIAAAVEGEEEDIKKENKLKDPPEEIKALYLTGWSAGNSSKMDGIIDLMNKEKLNAVVIDIKDYSGYVSYKSDVEEVSRYKSEQVMIEDLDGLLRKLHDNRIYSIARITVFQDPVLAVARPELAIKNKATGGVWKDNKGLAWIDPASTEAWDYIVKIAQDASNRGFDEINFDYIRIPSDGSLGNMSYPFYKKEE